MYEFSLQMIFAQYDILDKSGRILCYDVISSLLETSHVTRPIKDDSKSISRVREWKILVFYIVDLAHNVVILYKMYVKSMAMGNDNREDYPEKNLLTLSNMKFIIEGLDTLLLTDLDGEKRVRVIRLRDELVSYINSIFNDYS
ncbi:MAG TPA: hypothetical protein VH500_00355 [Nitrososphaeraceae archaeon]